MDDETEGEPDKLIKMITYVRYRDELRGPPPCSVVCSSLLPLPLLLVLTAAETIVNFACRENTTMRSQRGTFNIGVPSALSATGS